MKDCQERNECEDCIEIDECEDYIPKFKEEVLECPCKNCTIDCKEEKLNCTVCENCAICVPQIPVHRVTDHSALENVVDNEINHMRQECINCTIPVKFDKQAYLELCIIEEEIAKRTVLQHVCEAFTFLAYKNIAGFKHELLWALERLIRIGDYSYGGYFDSRSYDWR